ncbi:MAG: type IX secretion system membrane protein PorP/SprF [Bacteroidota bacterium]
MKKTLLMTVTLLAGILSCQKGYSQYDPMFTNYMWNEMFINPAYAGSREAASLVALHRQQWVGIDGAPVSQTISLHGPFFENKVGLGLSILHESIGVSNETSYMGTFAYRIKTSRKGRLSFGISGGVITLQEKLTDVLTTTPGDVHFQNNTPVLAMPNASFGMYYSTDKFYLGLSIPRMIYNEVLPQTWDVKSTLKTQNLHYYLTSGYVLDLHRGIKLKPTIMLKSVYAAPLEMDASINIFLRDFIWAGFAYRTGDAISLLLAVQLNSNLRLGYSYDYTTTRLTNYNSGTHEISLGYDFSLSKKKIVSPRVF